MSVLDELLRQISDKTDLSWKDETYDVARARGLSPQDRATYVKKLIEASKKGDTLAILTLGHLQAKEALPMLEAVARGDDARASTARRALVAMGRGDQIVDAIANDAHHSPSMMVRVGAVLDLAKISGLSAYQALDKAMDDPESTVRMLAWNGIVDCLELLPFMRSPAGILEKGSYLELLKDFLSSDVKSLNRMGAEEMRDLVRRFTEGESPVDLGISYAPDAAPAVSDAIIKAIVDPNKDYPTDAIAKLEGLPRKWSEAALALRAGRQDTRAPRALARLDATWTIPILEELAQSPGTPPQFREELNKALRELKAS